MSGAELMETETVPLLREVEAPTRRLDYDQFQRYRAVALIIANMFKNTSGTIRVLEVGCNVLNLLPLFLSERVKIMRCDVLAAPSTPDYVQIQSNAPLPFSDNAFDAVIALEVLEHIPAGERETFIAEMLRVAKSGIVITCPNGNDKVLEYEQIASESYRLRHGVPHPFLKEHLEFGLPCPQEVVGIFDRLAVRHAVFDNAPLDLWLPMLLIAENLSEREILSKFQETLAEAIRSRRIVGGPIPYRKIYVAALTPEAEGALEAPKDDVFMVHNGTSAVFSSSPLHTLAVIASEGFALVSKSTDAKAKQSGRAIAELESHYTNEIAVLKTESEDQKRQLFRRIADLLIKMGTLERNFVLQRADAKARDIEREETHRKEVSLLIARETSLRERSAFETKTLSRLLAAPYATKSWQLTKPMRFVRRLFFKEIHSIDYSLTFNLQHLGNIGTGSRWRALSPEAYFIVPGPIGVGRRTLSLKMHMAKPSNVYIDLDEGDGFVAAYRVLLAEETDKVDFQRTLNIRRPLRAIRFAPLDSPGDFTLQDLRIIREPQFSLAQSGLWEGAEILASHSNLVPVSQLRRDAAVPSRWIASGNDPQFLLPSITINEPVCLHLEIESDGPGRAQLYFDTGDGFNPTEQITIGRFNGAARFVTPIISEKKIQGLRFDPKDRPGSFLIRHFEIRRGVPATSSKTTVELRDLFELNEVVRGDHPLAFNATGHDPQFAANCHLPPGWYCVELSVSAERGGQATLYLDTGGDFNAVERVDLGHFSGQTLMKRYFRTVKTVSSIRLDPLEYPTPFELLKFSIKPVSAFTVATYIAWGMRGVTDWIEFGQKALCQPIFRSTEMKTWLKNRLFKLQSGELCSYQHWCLTHRMTPSKIREYEDSVDALAFRPRISVIMPVYNCPETYLRKAIESVRNQIYQNWELCIADDCSTMRHIKPILTNYAKLDSRIKVTFRSENGNISAASNTCLSMASGEFIALLDNDDELAPHALAKVAETINRHPDVDMLYSDEDKLDLEERHVDPFFKPDWSPEYLLACMYTCHLGVYRRSLVNEVGGFRSEYDNAQDYDLVLRVVARTNRIVHIPDILYHWRMLPTSTASNSGAKSNAHSVAQKALAAHLQETRRPGQVESGPTAGFHRVRFQIAGNPKVSIIIPTGSRACTIRGEQSWFLLKCVQSIRAKTTYKNYEIVVVDNNDMDPTLASHMEDLNVRRLHFMDPFNLAVKMNFGAAHAEGEHLVFMNDDIEAESADWMQSMLEFSQQQGIGAVGAKLLFPDNRLQHAGVTVLHGNPGHPFYGCAADYFGYFCGNVVHRNFSAVTGACLMTRKKVFEQHGGFDRAFPLNYNDVDYCLRLRESGLRIVYTPYAVLWHHESVTKQTTYALEELATFKARSCKFEIDPYYNPNLNARTGDYQIWLG